MSKDINTQAVNKVNIIGKLLETSFVEGKTKTDGRPYERGNLVVRVTQTYGGNEEVSEIPVSFFTPKFKKDGSTNPAYENIQALKKMKTAQNVGAEDADYIRITGAQLEENNFVSSRSGQRIDSWQIRSSFFNSGNTKQVASFDEEIYIMNIEEEMDRDENPTGRLKVRGAIVQYGGKLDVINFIVEHPDCVDYISRNYNTNTTVRVQGRIRVTSTEITKNSESSWGEAIPETTTVTTRELIITKGCDDPYEDDMAYSETDIRKAMNVRKARLEQMMTDKKAEAPKKQAKPVTDWTDEDF